MVLKHENVYHPEKHSFITFKTYMVLKLAALPSIFWQGFITIKTYMVLKRCTLSQGQHMASLPSKLTWFSNPPRTRGILLSASLPSKLTWFSNTPLSLPYANGLHHLQNLHGSQTLASPTFSTRSLHYLQNLHGSQTGPNLSKQSFQLHYLQNLHGSQTPNLKN